MANDRTIDELDLHILELLQNNARESQVDIARAVGLAPSAVLERVRKLEARGVIRGYAAQIDPRALEQSMLAFVSVRSDEAPGNNDIARALAACDEVLEVHHVAGEDCYLIKVRARAIRSTSGRCCAPALAGFPASDPPARRSSSRR